MPRQKCLIKREKNFLWRNEHEWESFVHKRNQSLHRLLVTQKIQCRIDLLNLWERLWNKHARVCRRLLVRNGALSPNSLSLLASKNVCEFYPHSDISWQAPGWKDRIIIRETTEDGEKVKRTEQIRLMLMSLREAYNKFKEENPSHKIGLSKFCALRPANVKLFDQIPHQVCVQLPWKCEAFACGSERAYRLEKRFFSICRASHMRY